MRIIYLLSITFILSACATTYQKAGVTGGYTETQLDANVYQVDFSGNAYISSQEVADFALLRSAELTLEKGYNYFVIIDGSKYSDTSSYEVPTAYGGYQTYTTSKPSASNTIVCFKEKPEGFSYNAKFIKESFREKYQLNKPDKAN